MGRSEGRQNEMREMAGIEKVRDDKIRRGEG